MNPKKPAFIDDQVIDDLSQDDQDKIRSQWLNQILRDNPNILSLRERLLPKIGGLSFANVVHTEDISSVVSIDRFSLLELIYQHLQAIGFYQTAELISKETSHNFQAKEQPWERTDLHLIASMAVGHMDNVWDISPGPGFEPNLEYLDEDFYSSPYTEDFTCIWDEIISNSLQIQYIPNKPKTLENIEAASLRGLTYTLISSNYPDQKESDKLLFQKQCFFLTLHSITSSIHFLDHIKALYRGRTSRGELVDQKLLYQTQKLIIKFLVLWVNFQGKFLGNRTLSAISQFLTDITQESSQQEITNNALQLLKLFPKITFGHLFKIDSSQLQEPNIPNPNVIFNPLLQLFDPEPIELARQITLICHDVFSEIPPLEFFSLLSEGKASIHTPTIQEFLNLSRRIGLLMAETIVNSPHTHEAYSKALLISNYLLGMGNFDAVGSIVSILKRQEFISAATITAQEFGELNVLLRQSGEDDKNAISRPTTYQLAIKDREDNNIATVPNIRASLINLDKSLVTQQDFKKGLINWTKRREIGSWEHTMDAFQSIPYLFCPIPQIQRLLKNSPISTEEAIIAKIRGKSSK